MLKHLGVWAQVNKIQFGLKKCKVVHFTPKRNDGTRMFARPTEVFDLDGGTVELVDSYLYLRLVVDDDLSFKREKDRRDGLVRSSLTRNRRFLRGNWPLAFKLDVIRSVTCAIASYGTEITGGSAVELRTRQSLIDQELCSMLGVKNRQPKVELVLAICGVLTFINAARRRQAKAL